MTCENIQNLNNKLGHTDRPRITACGDNVYVWQDSGPGCDIFFAESYDNGSTIVGPRSQQ